MNIPEFTADSSIYKTSRHYRPMTGASNASVVGRGVTPQLPIGWCQANCDSLQDPFERTVCEIQCIEPMDNGGGGGGVRYCHPTCGPCRPDARSPSGLSRLCRGYDCETEREDCI